jgi:hypothetical protein
MVYQLSTRSAQDPAAQSRRPRVLVSSGKPIALPRGSKNTQYVARNTSTCSKLKGCAHSMEVSSMKKLALLALFVALVGALASAQIISGNTSLHSHS